MSKDELDKIMADVIKSSVLATLERLKNYGVNPTTRDVFMVTVQTTANVEDTVTLLAKLGLLGETK